MRSGMAALLVMLLVMLTELARAATGEAVVEVTNEIRRVGCTRLQGLDAPLRPSPLLNAVAVQLLHGRSLEDSMARMRYQATAAASIRIGGHTDSPESRDTSIRRTLVARFCAQLASAEYEEIGIADDGQDLWLVIATPFSLPGAGTADLLFQRALELVNGARAQARTCGAAAFGAAAPLARSAALDRAAAEHAKELRVAGKLSHLGRDGSRPSDRISLEGYAWSAVAENLAAGVSRVEPLVEGWLASPGHCANIMEPRFTDMGIAYAASGDGAGEIYWVLELGAARSGM